MKQSRIARIRKMERIYARVRKDIATLREYEESGLWLQDYEADERGELPRDLKRGVLSQDGLDEVFEEAKSLNGYAIRRAMPSDLVAVNRLLRQVLRVHHDGRPDLFRESGKKYTDEEILAIFANPDTPVFVYDLDGTVLGYAFCVLQHSDSGSLQPLTTLYIDDLCVSEEARGRHIGSALFAYVRQFAKENGCYNITLHVWECNPGAKAFYESQGLKPQYTSLEWVC